MITSNRHIKLFEAWLNEATTEATDEEIQKLLNLMVPIIRKSVDDTMRIEVDFAKKLHDAENDNERSKLFTDMNAKKDAAEKPIELFLSQRGKISQSQMEKVLSWSKSMRDILFNKEMSTRENEFKALGTDVSRWKEMYDPAQVNKQMLLKNKSFEEETGIKPPLVV